MEHEIIGGNMPVLEVHLVAGESIVAVSGELSWMTASIELNTTTGAAGAGGFLGVFKRVAGGGSLFMTEYRAAATPGTVAFAAKIPGHILPVEMTSQMPLMIHRHGFLCSSRDVELSVGFQQSLGAGIFGGNGFLLQKLSGTGAAFVELGGEVVIRDLGAGETLKVHPGHVGMFETSVNFGITRITGIRNMLFGGDGIFLAELTGPGRVWLQTLTIANLAHALGPYLPGSGRDVAEVGAGAVIGSVLRGLTRG
jgi:uncharacterized protein (TIGR00266 family)